MNTRVRLLSLVGFAFILLASGARAQQQEDQPQIWFGTIDTVTGRDMHRPDPLAYMDFFKPDAPWQKSEARLDVFEVSTQFLLSSTDEQLAAVFNEMKRRNIPIGVRACCKT